MFHLSRTGLFFVGCSLAFNLSSSTSPLHGQGFRDAPTSPRHEGRLILNELAEIAFDPKNTIMVRDINIDRDSIHLTLNRGTLAFFTPVHGLVTGAVFLGEGEILVLPPNKIEKFQLHKFTGSPILNEKFDSAVFHFTDNTFQEITRELRESSPQESTVLNLDTTWKEAVHDLSLNLNYRILQNLLATPQKTLFHASLHGISLGWFEAFYDERANEPVLIGRVTHDQGRDFADIWTTFRSPRTSPADPRRFLRETQLFDITSVTIAAQIDERAYFDATAKVTFKFILDGERMLPFELSRALKITSVEDDAHHPLDFIQNSLLEAEEVGQRGNDLVFVLLDNPSRKNSTMTLHFRYAGGVISNLGSGIYFVGERGTWYPNHGLTDRAIYHLKFEYPAAMTLVATGNRISETVQETHKISIWDSEGEIGVAGFNFGEYLTKSRRVKNTDVEVYANRSLDDVVRSIQTRIDQIRAARLIAQQQARSRGQPFPPLPEPTDVPNISTQTLLSNVINDASSALQFFESLFGSYPYRKLALSQIPGRFGQSWPSLCYVSTFAFLTPSQQSSLGVSRDAQFTFSQIMRGHEIAHQWWGNLVTTQTYHDLWLTEGMANYAAYLFAGSKDPREKSFLVEMRRMKSHLLEKTRSGQSIESAGPLWLGWRLYSSKTPAGYQEVVYEKGSWVMHMLRMMMRDPHSESDERFFTAIRDFLKTHRDQTASTEDFKKTIEKYMTSQMDLEGNRKLDWFFDEWVYDVGIPEYRFNYSIKGSKGVGFVATGKIEQSGVPAGFEMPVPLFAHYGNREVWLGNVIVSGEEASFRFALPNPAVQPARLSLNENEAVLCVVKSK